MWRMRQGIHLSRWLINSCRVIHDAMGLAAVCTIRRGCGTLSPDRGQQDVSPTMKGEDPLVLHVI